MMADVSSTQEIKLPLGTVRGAKFRSVYSDEYYSFEGIPYAQPPLGELRFRTPKPVEPWQGVKDCTKCASKPAQINEFKKCFEGSEDCLYLNVYTKRLHSDKPLPVMVYIYGGGFVCGGANRELYGPDYFMMKDIVLVTLNYRLCSLGFLSFKDPTLNIPGNAGLKDQIMALKWIKDNIGHFNGDCNNITIFGESAGAASVHYMMCTEQTRGLFHKAIQMSGCVLNPWAFSLHEDRAFRLAKYHGYSGENVEKQVLEYLNTLSAEKLVHHDIFSDEDKRNGLLFAFGPTIEPYTSENCVITAFPIELVRSAWGYQIPTLIGGTSFEGLFLYSRLKPFPNKMKTMGKNPVLFLPLLSKKELRDDVPLTKLAEKLIQLHFDGRNPDENDLMKFLHFYSYKIIWHGIRRTVEGRLNRNSADTYYYRFDFDSPTHNQVRKLFCGQDVKEGVCHADDLGYIFYGELGSKLEAGTQEYQTMERMIGAWTAFAANGDPNCAQISSVHWRPLSKSNRSNVLNISKELTLTELPENEKLIEWHTLYKPEYLF